MDLTAVISENVKRIRKSRGMTQKEFAERAGVSHYTVISIEHGKTTSLSVLEQLARAYEIDPADLVSTKPATQKPLMDAIDIESVVSNDFKALPPFKQAFYQAMAVKLDRLYDAPLNESYDNYKERLLTDVERWIDLIDPTSMTAVEVKQAAIEAVRDAVQRNKY